MASASNRHATLASHTVLTACAGFGALTAATKMSLISDNSAKNGAGAFR